MKSEQKQPQSANKRTMVLEATLKLLSERGFNNTPMSLIVKESGVSTGNVYHHFANKDELIMELHAEIKKSFLAALLDGFDKQGSFEGQFIRFWKAVVSYYLRHPRETRFLEQFENSPYFEKKVHEQYANQMLPLINFFQRGMKEGIIKNNIPFELLSSMALSTAVVLVKYHLQGKISLTNEVVETAAQAAWDMMKK